MVARGPGELLLGRRDECEVLDRLLAAVRGRQSGVLVLRGEPGVGKSALLEYAIKSASGLRLTRAVGVESEMELPFAALQQLCGPMQDRLERLPGPQRDALGVAFGLSAGEAPDRFLVGLAMLSLLSEVAEEQPLLCVVDDAQWLDRASAQALAFVARRLLAEPIAFIFAARESSDELTGLPELLIHGLHNGDARALLSSVLLVRLDEGVQARIVAETRGNPLALLELPWGLTSPELAGGFGLLDAPGLSGRIEESFRRRLAGLPVDTQRLLLVAAAEPVGDPVLVWQAAQRLGIGVKAAAETDGLLAIDTRVTFRHPLVRSAAYRAASLPERRAAHRALAEVTDPEIDPDRRAWHRAQATSGPDDDVASDLERSADRAQARGGLAAAGAFLEKAAALTLEPTRRAERALSAAQAKRQAGAFDAAVRLVATAEAGPLNEFQRAQMDVLRAQIAFAASRGNAPSLLLMAAKRLESLDVTLAREIHLDALGAGLFASRLARGAGVLEVAEAVRAAPRPSQPLRARDLLLDGLALLITAGHAAGCADLEAGAGRRRQRRDLEGGRLPLVLDLMPCRRPYVGLRELGRALGPQRPARTRSRRTQRPSERAQHARRGTPLRGRTRPRRVAGRRGGRGQRRDREQHRTLRRSRAGRLPRPRAGGVRADRGCHEGGGASRRGRGADLRSVDIGGALQRPRPL
jgi:hypothetical protein